MMATSAKCGNKQTDKKRSGKPLKCAGKVTKQCKLTKTVNPSEGNRIPKKNKTKDESKKSRGNLKSAYVALEYKHFHNIGNRKASEQVITYDETVPIYESQLKMDCNSNKISLSPGDFKACCLNKKLSMKKKFASKDSKSTIRHKCLKGLQSKAFVKLKTFSRPRREASLNAKAKLNILYHDNVKNKDCVESSDEETFSFIAKLMKKNKKKYSSEKIAQKPASKLKKDKCKKNSKASTTKPKSKKDKNKLNIDKQKVKKKFKKKKTKTQVSVCEEYLENSGPKYARRMASLNAEAIMSASWPPLNSSTQKTTDNEELKAARTRVYVSPKKDIGRWVDGRGEDPMKSSQNPKIMTWTPETDIKSMPSKSDPLLLNNNNMIPVERASSLDPHSLCHPYQSPIHVNVDDCGPYVSNPTSHIANPLPRYPTYTPSNVAPANQCQAFTLGTLGSLGNVPIMPFHQTYNSAFSVPCNHAINVPCNHGNACSLTTPYYSYVPNTYYPSGMSDSACLLPRPVQCPQAEVKVLIHNPHNTDHAFLCEEPMPLEVTSPAREALDLSCPQSTNTLPASVKPSQPNIPPKVSKKKETERKQKDPQKTKKSETERKQKDHKKSKKIETETNYQDPKNKKTEKRNKLKSNLPKLKKKQKSPENIGDIKQKKLQENRTHKKKKVNEKNDKIKKEKKDVPLTNVKVPVTDFKSSEKAEKKANKKTEKVKQTENLQVHCDENHSKIDSTLLKAEDSSYKPKRKRNSHGWSWSGIAEKKQILTPRDAPAVERSCYIAMKHTDGDEIRTGDCVLVCSGPRKADVPYVAKVTSLWENAEDEEMMMSLLWYYRPEHTDSGRKPNHMDVEVFASKHRDENSVACIEDKCYVLTYNEYCRYRADLRCAEEGCTRRSRVVPETDGGYPRAARLPPIEADPEIVLLCRQVYDFRQKRVLKNPS